MPRYIIERNFAEKVEMNSEIAEAITRVNEDVGVEWIYSFLSLDRRKTYCLYDAPNAEAIIEAARRLGAPADSVIDHTRPSRFKASITASAVCSDV